MSPRGRLGVLVGPGWLGPAWLGPVWLSLAWLGAGPVGTAAAETAGAAAPPSIGALEDQLARANTGREAGAIQGRILALEGAELAPTVTVLLDAAHGALASGKPGDAVRDLDSALVLQPDPGALWRERAIARLHTGDLDGATADLGQAIDRDGRDVLSWTTLSDVAAMRGANTGAYAAWQKVMTLEPAVPGGAERLDRLKRLALGERA